MCTPPPRCCRSSSAVGSSGFIKGSQKSSHRVNFSGSRAWSAQATSQPMFHSRGMEAEAWQVAVAEDPESLTTGRDASRAMTTGYPVVIISFFPTFWETSTQENLTPEASDRPETRLELLTRISSIRFVSPLSHFENIGTPKEPPSHSNP